MPRRPDFQPLETAKGWMVSVPPALTVDGKRVRSFFPEWKAANAYAATLRKTHGQGLRGSLLPVAMAMQALRASKMLEPVGISLVEAARMAVEALRDDSAKEVFAERYRQAVVAGEGFWSDRYARDMDKIPRWMGPVGMRMRCGELTEPVVEKLLKAGGARALSTLEMRRARVLAALNWKPRTRKTEAVGILTVAQCAALLRACESREQVRAVALLLFAGIRPDAVDGEISRLNWSAVSATEIYVAPEVSKTKTDRHVPVLPRLRRLLAGHPPQGGVMPANWKRVWQRLRKEAGISEMQDAARHTFASNLLAYHGGDEGPVKMAMGHVPLSSTLRRFYQRAVTVEAGRKFFGER